MPGGKKTSIGGALLEQAVNALKMLDFEVMKARDFQKMERKFQQNGERFLLSNWPYTTMFGTPGRREYHVVSNKWSGDIDGQEPEVEGWDFVFGSGRRVENLDHVLSTNSGFAGNNTALIFRRYQGFCEKEHREAHRISESCAPSVGLP